MRKRRDEIARWWCCCYIYLFAVYFVVVVVVVFSHLFVASVVRPYFLHFATVFDGGAAATVVDHRHAANFSFVQFFFSFDFFALELTPILPSLSYGSGLL